MAEAARLVRVHDLGSEPVTTFLVIGVAGLVLLAASLVVGDLLDGALDVLPGDAFSSAVIGAFISAFGFGALAAEALDQGRAVAVACGIVAGVLFGWFAAWLTRLVRDGGSVTPPGTGDTVGHEGRVVTGIPVEGFGVVHVQVGGHNLQLNARADQPLATGTRIHVTGTLSPTAVTVAPIWNEVL